MKRKAIVISSLIIWTSLLTAQVTGMWKMVDEKDGEAKSIVEIYEENDRYFGRVVKVLPTSKRTHCDKCEGQLKGRPLTGMIILYDLKKTANGARDGKVLHPANGKIYSCNLVLTSPDILKLRGYLGVPTIGVTQHWTRVK